MLYIKTQDKFYGDIKSTRRVNSHNNMQTIVFTKIVQQLFDEIFKLTSMVMFDPSNAPTNIQRGALIDLTTLM